MAVLGRDKECSKFRELTKYGEYFRLGEVFSVRSHTHNELFLFETVYSKWSGFLDYCKGCDFKSICEERRTQFLPLPACAPEDRLDGRRVHFKKI